MLVKWLERSAGLLLVAIGAIIFLWKKNMMFALIFAGVGVVILVLTFISKKEKSNITLANFINVFTHFRVALDNNLNVYRALNITMTTTSGAMATLLESLINALENDHSVTPFINFALPFKHPLVSQIMINVYMLVNHGIDPKRLWQFNYLFETLVKEHNDAEIALHESSYERFNISLFVGTGVMIMTLMISIMGMIGAYIA
ncbi:MAG: hypothetical protein BWX74_00086 [Tenericutes bacterium ADurb.Bin087]|nr:MAG: hypothetical protein BWX74_00086 [Tenericutes bacterium ADurb.Bin087]